MDIVYTPNGKRQLNTYMKKFKEFLEDYDVYVDKPMGFKKVEPEVDELEVTDTEDTAQEEIANEVKK